MSRFRNIAPLIVAGAALVGLAGCSSSNQQAAATPPAAPMPAPAPAPAPPPAPMVNPMAPSTLREVQTALQQDGLYKGKVDGKWGPQTRRAVLAYQHQNGLHATGHLDQATLSALHVGGEGSTSSSMNGTGGGSMGSMAGGSMGSMAGSPAPAGGTAAPASTNP